MSSNQGFIQQQDGQGKGKTNQKNLIGHHLFLGMGNRGALKAEDCEQKQQTGDGGQKVEIPKREHHRLGIKSLVHKGEGQWTRRLGRDTMGDKE